MADAVSTAPDFGLFERDVLPERIAARLVKLIAERQLRPGDRLPPERDLALQMHVSRASLREALRALAILNVVEIRQGSGTYVASLKPKVLVEHLDFIFTIDDSTFAELLEARLMLEPGLAAAAAVRATDEELAQLRACVSRSAEVVDDPNAFLAADLEMHQLISVAARNQIIERLMESLTRLGRASRKRTTAIPGVRARSLQEHRAIVDALERRDPQAAADIMRQHLQTVVDGLREAAGQDGAGEAAFSVIAPVTTPGGPHVTDHHVG